MRLYIITVGDSTVHGGAVISGSGTGLINGQSIARVGDLVSCPRHGINKIVEGHLTFTIDSKSAALRGCKTECGSVLLGISDDTTSH
jgi:uncharacterized Zn-binding protein involved in type VI secretion